MATTDDQIRDFIITNFPSYAWAMNIPDLWNIIKGAVTAEGAQTMSQDQLASKLQATPWWKTHGEAQRQYLQLSNLDPDTLAEHIQAKDADVHVMANQLGLSDAQVNIEQMARNAIMFGWDDAELREQLSALAKFNPQAPYTSNIGTIDNSMMALKQKAGDYMINVDDPTLFTWARDVAAGHHNVEDYIPLLQQQAIGKFPSLATYINQGITPKQYFDPMQTEVANLLEVPKDGVDLVNDPKFSKIVSYTDPKTNAPRPMTLSETQQYVRSMDQWSNTKQAKQAEADMSEGILNMFGKVSSNAGGVQGPANAY